MKIRDSKPIGNYAWIKDELKRIEGAPLETPSHNGPYIGKIPVRTLPYGITGDRTEAQTNQCKACGRPFTPLPGKYFCRDLCRGKWRRSQRAEARLGPKDARRGPISPEDEVTD